jgi:hypothetical protein
MTSTAAPRIKTAPRDPFDYDLPDPAASGSRHLDRYRRVHVGPAISLVFEDRHTLSFRMQELARFARRAVGPATQRQIEWYRKLMPGGGRLTAAVWVGLPGCRPMAECAALRRNVAAGTIAFRSEGGWQIDGEFLRERVSDRLLGMVGWIAFRFTADERKALANARNEWRIVVDTEEGSHESEPLGYGVRRSLASDLAHLE